MTPAMAAFAADMVPMAVAHGFGAFAGGTSLDNTIRFGPFDAGEWVLLDLRANGAVGDYGHGVAHVWSEDGRWIATASYDSTVKLWNAGAGTELLTFRGNSAPIVALAFSPDGTTIAAQGFKAIGFWQLER